MPETQLKLFKTSTKQSRFLLSILNISLSKLEHSIIYSVFFTICQLSWCFPIGARAPLGVFFFHLKKKKQTDCGNVVTVKSVLEQSNDLLSVIVPPLFAFFPSILFSKTKRNKTKKNSSMKISTCWQKIVQADFDHN